MILNLDMTGKELVVTKNPRPKLDQSGNQRSDKETGLPIWATQVVVTDESGGEVITISTRSEQAPEVQVGDEVTVIGLVAFPWASGRGSGVAYRADSLKVFAD